MKRIDSSIGMNHPMIRRAATLALAGSLAGFGSPLVAQGTGRAILGPRDGAGMAPLDTGRVAPGTMAPDFTLEAKDGGTVTLSQFRGGKNVVLVFYRGHW